MSSVTLEHVSKRFGEVTAVNDMTIEVKDKKQLERIVTAIRRISGVRDIERVNPQLKQ